MKQIQVQGRIEYFHLIYVQLFITKLTSSVQCLNAFKKVQFMTSSETES